jgi:tetratricopeptide (TPR) repeat protein
MIARPVLGLLAAVLLAGGAARAQTTQAPAPAATPPAAAPSAAARPAPPAAPIPLVLEKLAQGDRALASGELRTALFAYQDAVYAQPGHLFSRVKLGRAYLAMHYPSFAAAQAEFVLASDPSNPDALQLLEEARRTPGREIPAPPSGERSAARTFKITPAEPSPPAGGPAPAPEPPREAPPAATAAGPTAAQRYRAGVELYGKRDYAGAVAELSEAIALDPRLAVAYAARASARFGLGRYREAADDYKASLGLDPGLATPLYGLAECYRQLGDPAAAEMYQRYADSKAADVREDLRALAAKRAQELTAK